jgi:hypothetical protein
MANTTRFLIEIPDVGADADQWGTILNNYFNALEPKIFDRSAGDTVSGPLTVTGSTSVTTLIATGTITAPRLNGATTLELQTGGTTKVTVDNAGNAGLGVVPSAWGSLVKAFQVGGTSSLQNFNNLSTSVGQNVYFDGSVERYLTTATATRYTQSLGQHSWATAPSGTAGAPITFSQAMTLTQGGNLLVGTTTAQGKLSVVGSTANDYLLIDNAAGGESLMFARSTLVFGTGANIERARITSGGFFKASNTGVYNAGVNSAIPEINGNGPFGLAVYGTATTGGESVHLSQMPTTNGYSDLYRGINGGTVTYKVLANGTVQNSTGLYQSISDRRVKDNPQPLTGSGDFIDALQPKTWDWNEASGKTGKSAGFIADEFQQIVPDAVTGQPDAVDEEGKPVYQAIDASTSEVMANIVAELQALRKRVAELEAKE